MPRFPGGLSAVLGVAMLLRSLTLNGLLCCPSCLGSSGSQSESTFTRQTPLAHEGKEGFMFFCQQTNSLPKSFV